MEIQSFALEQLEERALFSVVAPLSMAPVAQSTAATHQAAAATNHSPLTGAFNVSGTYSHPISPGGPGGNPDVGTPYEFTGRGKKVPLGRFKLTGALHTPGFINNAKSHGQFVITTSRGTITIDVHGPPQTPGVLPPSLAYRIVKGTGAYVNSVGKGKMIVSASDTTHKFLFRFNATT
jgi:hypothetical protein